MTERFTHLFRSMPPRATTGFLIAAVLLGLAYFFVNTSTFLLHHPVFSIVRNRLVSSAQPEASSSAAHRYDDPLRSVGQVHVTAVYFVPRDIAPDQGALAAIDATMRNLERFHKVQFGETSRFDFTLLPFPVIGQRPDEYYEASDTSSLSDRERITEKLNRISDELEQYTFVQPADMSRVYPVEYIFYEGVGAGGGIAIEESKFALGGAIVARQFLTDPEYFYKDSFVAHEFYHSLGVTDQYDVEGGTAAAFSDDIMGAGRYRSLEATYLSNDILKRMGLRVE